MKCSNKINSIACLIVLALTPSTHANIGNQQTPVSIDVTTTINYVTPTCNVDVAPTYELGELTKGAVTTHADLPVNIDCQNIPDIFTSLTAISSANTVTSTTHKLQLINDNDYAWLSLADYSSGTDVDIHFDNTTTFCRANQNTLTRTCHLKVRTQVEAGNTKVGGFSVPVTFSLVYL